MSDYILELKDVVKTFGGVRALNGVHFQLKKGEIHALMGENGAGKSTFIKVITGVIKANFPARIAFRVSSKVDSRVILDSMGAEKLLGRGDMLFLPPGKANPERIHGAYISDSEIETLVEYLKTQPKPMNMIEMTKPEMSNIDEFEYDDDLFPEAARLVVAANSASVSMFQRHFKIGYARAGRLIDLLERAQVVGPHVGSKPREVLMSMEDLDATEFNQDN